MIKDILIEGVRSPYTVTVIYENGYTVYHRFYSYEEAVEYSMKKRDKTILKGLKMDSSIGNYDKVDNFKMKGR